MVTSRDLARGFQVIQLSSLKVGHKVRVHGGFFTVHELSVRECESGRGLKYVVKGRTNSGGRVNRTFYASMRSTIGVKL